MVNHKVNDHCRNIITLPHLATLAEQALNYGEVEALVGLRHYSEEIQLHWDTQHPPGSHTPVYHAYGFGGAGLTMAPAAATQISHNILQAVNNTTHIPDVKTQEVVILGAGYIGILAALKLRADLNKAQQSQVAVRVIAHSLPRGISTLLPECHEPRVSDNYASQIAGGWIMPVSVGALKEKSQWAAMVQESQHFWQQQTSDPILKRAAKTVSSLVFHDNDDLEEDKSGIHQANNLSSPPLYPKSPCFADIHGYNLDTTNLTETEQYPFPYVDMFEDIIQVDTTSVLRHYTRELLKKGITLQPLAKPVASFAELLSFLKPDTHTYIVNASGNGAASVFNCPPSQPIRGDLVVLKIPLEHIPSNLLTATHYSYWVGSHYVFLRYELDRPWLQVVLGGTFLKNDSDLTIRPHTLRDIISFWLDFFHTYPGHPQSALYTEKKTMLMERLVRRMI